MDNSDCRSKNATNKILAFVLTAAIVINGRIMPVSASETSTPEASNALIEVINPLKPPFILPDLRTNQAPDEKPKERKVVSTALRSVSAYNAGDVRQCDSDPCRAANGENICLALELGYKRCAANFVPFGTVLEIDGYGECLVTDRMNPRFNGAVDIAMKYNELDKAKQWGRRRLTVKIVKYVSPDAELAVNK